MSFRGDSIKVLLSTPPGKTSEKWPPLGLLYIASSIKARRKDDITIIDAFCENLGREELVSKIVSLNPDVVGLNCSTHTFLDTLYVLRKVKHSLDDVITVLGGYHATFTSRRILNEYDFIDFLIKGEGEESFVELLDRLDAGQDLTDVPGIGFKHDGVIVDNDFQLIKDLDAIPFPDRDLVSGIDYGYAHQGIPLTPGKFTTICTSRGCPFRCTYCSCTVLSKGRWRKRSPENVVDELILLSDQGHETCVFIDDSFTQDRARVKEICRMIRESGIQMHLYCEGRVDRADLDLLKDMKRSGFDVIYFGAESASEHVLEYYNKRTKPEQIREAVSNAKKVGMLAVTSYIVGAPVETREDFALTIDLIRETRPHGIQMNILDCLVGTPIWDELEANGLIGPNDWKTNHRIYEYFDRFTKEDLDTMANDGYKAHIEGWMRPRSLLEIVKLFLANPSLRKIIGANYRNPNLRKRVLSSNVYEGLESSYDTQSAE